MQRAARLLSLDNMKRMKRLSSIEFAVVLGLSLALVACWPSSCLAQPATVTAEEAMLRKEPSGPEPGAPVGRLLKDATVEVLRTRGAWREVAIDGWMWTESIADDNRDGYDGVVLHEGGENLRKAPNGPIAARLFDGALIERLEEQGGWTNVRRIGWVWFQAVSDPDATVDGDERASLATPGMAATTSLGASLPTSASYSPLVSIEIGADGAVLRADEGARVATLDPGAAVEILEREASGRARVRVEGWIDLDVSDPDGAADSTESRKPVDSIELASAAPSDASSASSLTDTPATPAMPATENSDVATDIRVGDVRAAPGAYDGRTLQWEVEFVSLLHADAMRVDFQQGEPFILARSRDEKEGFAYLAVPPDMVARAEEFLPLQNLRVVGRVRTRRAPTVGNPILDVVEIEEIR